MSSAHVSCSPGACTARRCSARRASARRALSRRSCSSGRARSRCAAASTACSQLTTEERRRGVISISAGNHGAGVAWAAARGGRRRLVVMWQGASPLKVEATRGYGATVDPPRRTRRSHTSASSRSWSARGASSSTRSATRRRRRPGHGRARDPRGRSRTSPRVVPVGGGGLVAGIVTALEGRGARGRRRAGALAGAARRARGRAVASRSSRAASPTRSAPRSRESSRFEICRGLGSIASSSARTSSAMDAFRWIYARMKLACELGAAASAGGAALRQGRPSRAAGRSSSSSPAATWRPDRPLLFWLHEGRNPSRVRHSRR